MAWAGRKIGKPIGSHIDDFIQLRIPLTLCGLCCNKFDARWHRYFRERRFGCDADCDACRVNDLAATLFVPEELLIPPSSHSNRGQGSWLPP